MRQGSTLPAALPPKYSCCRLLCTSSCHGHCYCCCCWSCCWGCCLLCIEVLVCLPRKLHQIVMQGLGAPEGAQIQVPACVSIMHTMHFYLHSRQQHSPKQCLAFRARHEILSTWHGYALQLCEILAPLLLQKQPGCERVGEGGPVHM
jgi:hypothetical protein